MTKTGAEEHDAVGYRDQGVPVSRLHNFQVGEVQYALACVGRVPASSIFCPEPSSLRLQQDFGLLPRWFCP